MKKPKVHRKVKKLTKEQRRLIYEDALFNLVPDKSDSLCINHFSKHFPMCVKMGVHYGCNNNSVYGAGQLIEFESFSFSAAQYTPLYPFNCSTEINADRVFVLQLCIEMTK